MESQFTLMAVRSMAGGLPLDLQRECRWPNQTNPVIEVEWKPWQDDSDFSDTEGVLDSTGALKAHYMSNGMFTNKNGLTSILHCDNVDVEELKDQEVI
jgi:hypothetical protein